MKVWHAQPVRRKTCWLWAGTTVVQRHCRGLIALQLRMIRLGASMKLGLERTLSGKQPDPYTSQRNGKRWKASHGNLKTPTTTHDRSKFGGSNDVLLDGCLGNFHNISSRHCSQSTRWLCSSFRCVAVYRADSLLNLEVRGSSWRLK